MFMNVILLQLPEFLSLFLSYLNRSAQWDLNNSSSFQFTHTHKQAVNSGSWPFFISLITAPTKSPTIHYAQGINTTSIQFNLSSPQPYYASYDVTGYIVHYWKVESSSRRNLTGNSSATNVAFPPGTIRAILTGLEAYKEYCLSARLVSSFGAGVSGPCTIAMTLEGGKLLINTNSFGG